MLHDQAKARKRNVVNGDELVEEAVVFTSLRAMARVKYNMVCRNRSDFIIFTASVGVDKVSDHQAVHGTRNYRTCS